MRVAVLWAPAEARDERSRWSSLAAQAERARAAGADLLLLPELALFDPQRPITPRAGEPSDGPCAHTLAAIARAHELALVAGYLEACSGKLFSAALVVSAQGVAIANYRRTHLRAGERPLLSAGAWLSLVPFGDRKLGLLIGYDLHFPEVARLLVLEGADGLLVLGARACEPRHAVETLLRARALENGVPVAYAGWAGADAAPAALFGPDGRLLARAERPDSWACAELPAHDPRAAGLAERRPRLYQGLMCELSRISGSSDREGSTA